MYREKLDNYEAYRAFQLQYGYPCPYLALSDYWEDDYPENGMLELFGLQDADSGLCRGDGFTDSQKYTEKVYSMHGM